MTELYQDERVPARFWGNIAVDQETDCWTWTGGIRTSPGGYSYPVFCSTALGGKGPLNAARVARALLIGDIDIRSTGNDQLRTTCGNALCTNPDHTAIHTRGRSLLDVGWCRRGIHRIQSRADTVSAGRNGALDCKQCRNTLRSAQKATLVVRPVQETGD